MQFVEVQNRKYQVNLKNNSNLEGTLNGDAFSIDLQQINEKEFHIIQNNVSFKVEVKEINREEKYTDLIINGKSARFKVGDRFDELLKSMGMGNLNSTKLADLKAPMPGLVLDIRVQEGQQVSKGDALLVLEAMKMENILKASQEGKVSKIEIKKGQAVEKGQILLRFA